MCKRTEYPKLLEQFCDKTDIPLVGEETSKAFVRKSGFNKQKQKAICRRANARTTC